MIMRQKNTHVYLCTHTKMNHFQFILPFLPLFSIFYPRIIITRALCWCDDGDKIRNIKYVFSSFWWKCLLKGWHSLGCVREGEGTVKVRKHFFSSKGYSHCAIWTGLTSWFQFALTLMIIVTITMKVIVNRVFLRNDNTTKKISEGWG